MAFDDVAFGIAQAAKKRVADKIAAQGILGAQQTAPAAASVAAPDAGISTIAADAANTGKAYGAGRLAGRGVGVLTGLAAKTAIASPIAGFGDYKINDPAVDTSAGGVIGNLASGEFAKAGRGLQNDALEAGLDTASGIAKFGDAAAGLVGASPNLAGKLAGRVQSDLGSQVTINPSLLSNSSAAPSIIPSAQAAPVAATVATPSVSATPQSITSNYSNEPTQVPSVPAATPVQAITAPSAPARSVADIDANSLRILSGMSETAQRLAAARGENVTSSMQRDAANQRIAGDQEYAGYLANKNIAQQGALQAQSAGIDNQLKQGQLNTMQTLDQLRQSIAKETDPAKSRLLQDQYLALQGKTADANKRYVVIPGEEYMAPDGINKLKRPTQVLDAYTQKLVDTGSQAQPKVSAAQAVADAQDAVSRGASKDAVNARLKQLGYPTI